MKLVSVVGARPQFVKAAVVSRAVREHNATVGTENIPISEVILHTGQHFDDAMSKVFFDQLGMPEPDYNLDINQTTHGAMTGRMLCEIEKVLMKEQPDWVLVHGDTNSALAGALAAAKLHIPLAHVEAGLRSFNTRMPEEVNRILTDRISTLLFCPTIAAIRHLERESFCKILNDGKLVDENEGPVNLTLTADSAIAVNVGDVMYDSAKFNLTRAEKESDILKDLDLIDVGEIKSFYLATVHRSENTDDLERLKGIVEALGELSESVQVVWPIHPRTKAKMAELDPALSSCWTQLMIVDPLPYLDMILLEKSARLILTDSGGIQKEAFFFRTPCITLRDETEWTELVDMGVNVVVGVDKQDIVQATEQFAGKQLVFPEGHYGKGTAGKSIVRFLNQLQGH